jgi:hypothetical protein
MVSAGVRVSRIVGGRRDFPEVGGRRARATQQEVERKNGPAKRHEIRDEIRRDVVPFYLLARLSKNTRKDFVDVCSEMWRRHVDTFSQIKAREEQDKIGSSKIDYVAGHLDIIDRKFGVLLTVQSLIGFVVSLTLNTFKDDLLRLFKIPLWQIAVTELVLLAVFLIFAWGAAALDKLPRLIAVALFLAVVLYYFRNSLPKSVAPGLMVFLAVVWFITTLLCLRGAGARAVGEMKAVNIGDSNAQEQLTQQHDYQLTSLIRALVGRSALYRAAVLLVFTNLYALLLTGYVTALALSRTQPAPVNKEQAQPIKGPPELRYDVHFRPGKTCDTSETAKSDIRNIARMRP